MIATAPSPDWPTPGFDRGGAKQLFDAIHGKALRLQCGIGRASVAEVDQLNILQTTLLAMRRAITGSATQKPTLVLVDGNRLPVLGCAR